MGRASRGPSEDGDPLFEAQVRILLCRHGRCDMARLGRVCITVKRDFTGWLCFEAWGRGEPDRQRVIRMRVGSRENQSPESVVFV